MKPKEFSQEEFELILGRSQELIRKGYFTGINFLQSEKLLPQEHIIIHFLHNSRLHIDDMLSKVPFHGEIIPRYSFYKTKPEYFQRGGMKEKYSEALFFNQKGELISTENTLASTEEIYTLNPELDLLIPLSPNENLESLVREIQHVDNIGIAPWIDPVIIIRPESSLALPDFVERTCISLTKDKEEFYTILPTLKKKKAVVKYLKRLCRQTTIGSLRYTDIVLTPSHINKSFAKYLGH
ncbi:hypothetical protein HZA98_03190 [Candidatus Woesearchaeota archaeon]|nr:hypothetical protein [Candidatus Woesearchaeota archaeon]